VCAYFQRLQNFTIEKKKQPTHTKVEECLRYGMPIDYDENILNGGDKNYGQSGYTGKLTENNLLILQDTTCEMASHVIVSVASLKVMHRYIAMDTVH